MSVRAGVWESECVSVCVCERECMGVCVDIVCVCVRASVSECVCKCVVADHIKEN